MGLPTACVRGIQLRFRGQQVGPALEQFRGLARPGLGHCEYALRRRDVCRVGRLVADQHGDTVTRDGGERLERRDRGARARGGRPRPLDVERRAEAHAMARRDEPQCLVLCGRDRAHGLELAHRADQHEVVGRDVAQHEQAHATHAVLDRQCVGLGGLGARAQATGEVDFPGHVDTGAAGLRVGNFLGDGPVVAGSLLVVTGDAADARQQPRPADRRAGARGAQALGRDLTSRFSRAARTMRSERTGSW